MILQITPDLKNAFNQQASHPLQSFEWGKFREKTGIKVVRKGFEKDGKLVEGFQLTIHKFPHTPWNIGYLPKGNMPTKETIEELVKIGREENCIFIQLEPNIIKNHEDERFKTLIHDSRVIIQPSAHPLFTKYTLVLDLTKSEEELLKNMHSKTRYNIKVAQKHAVEVKEDNSEKAFERYLELTRETTTRQGFFAHTEKYHRLMWETLKIKNHNNQGLTTNDLSAHLLTATYQGKILVTWIVFVFHDTLYYPYGASSSENREAMASTAMMWETIRWGKKMGLQKFDMWGALGPEPDSKDPWFGFHRFKQGFGPDLVEFVGSYDLVINPLLYQGYKIADKLRWAFLKLKR